MHPSLAHHYDAKYAREALAREPAEGPEALIPRLRAPTTRSEACVSFFPRFFRGGHVLELGAGAGGLAHSLIASGLACDSYTVSETSDARLSGLRQRFAKQGRVRVEALDAESLADAHRGRFDAVILVALIEHLVDPLRALQQLRGLLRPGGFVYLDTPNAAKLSRRLKLLFGRFPSTASRDEGLTSYAGEPVDLHDEGHLHYFTYRSLTRLLVERCGFSRVTKLAYASPPAPLGLGVAHALAKLRPELFSELCVIAHA